MLKSGQDKVTGGPIGFSTGCLYEIMDTNSPPALQVIADVSTQAVEVMCFQPEVIGLLPALVPHLEKFRIKSLHFPTDIKYCNTREIRLMIGRLSEFYQAIGASLAIVHPDLVENWNVFKGRPMRMAIENMDNRKNCFRLTIDLKKFFADHPEWLMVLDLNHCGGNDRTLNLADEMIEEFSDRIAEVHVSGYGVDGWHIPLHQTKQIEIVRCLVWFDCPIIIESPFKNAIGLKRELEFIRQTLISIKK